MSRIMLSMVCVLPLKAYSETRQKIGITIKSEGLIAASDDAGWK